MTASFKVQEIHCGACAKRVTTAIQAVQPGANVQVDIASGLVTVHPAGDAGAIVKAITDAGYPAVPA
ncbi:heavy-metal-associated domain-containing protein [Thalassobaculum sp.]|uniref:heavy-metal-associated domain-containing protein n=1 Tax=Thalassobaculum sp. TaxID=2022740 RepID=UPI0032EFB6CB